MQVGPGGFSLSTLVVSWSSGLVVVRRRACEMRCASDGVHPGVARSLGRLVVLSEGRTPSHPDAAELRPCHPDRVTPTALRERCRSHKELCLEVLAVGHKVGHKDKHLRRQWR